MHRNKPFDSYIPLAQEELELPLYDVIQNLNWLIESSLDPSHIAIFMEKYNDVFSKLPGVFTTSGLCSVLLHDYFDDMFTRMVDYPMSICPLTMISVWQLPPYVRETWSIITSCQVLLPCVVNCKKAMEQQLGKKVTNAIIICAVDQYLKEKFQAGFNFITSVIDAVFNDYVKEQNTEIATDARNALKQDVYADVFLSGFTRISLLPTHHVNMIDVAKLVSDVVKAHPALQPAVLPPTNMF